jgi:hypothetical protein
LATLPLVSEEDLHAFVDGETDAQTNAAILALLAASPADAARVEAWRSQNELIRASFAKIEHEPIPLSLSLTPPRTIRNETLVHLVPATAAGARDGDELMPQAWKASDLAKLCAAIGIAFAGGMIAALVTPHLSSQLAEILPSHPPSIARAAADLPLPFQTLEIAGLREKNPTADQGLKIKDELISKGVREDFNPAPMLFRDLAALELSVEGFQIGTAASDPALCLFLATKAAEPLTLCLEKTASTESLGFRATEVPPLRSVDWPERIGHFALAGRLPQTALLDLAQRIHARVGASNPIR